jgi:hypothetical protein
MLASALSLVLRYRRAGDEQREQIKWMAFAASVVGLLYLITMVSSLTFSGTWGAAGAPLWLGLLQQAALVSFTAVPIALGFAVLKYRLYDIDVVINHTLVQPAAPEGAGVRRSSLLPQEVRCQKDP